MVWSLNPNDGTLVSSQQIGQPEDQALQRDSQARTMAVSSDGELLVLGMFSERFRVLRLDDLADLGQWSTELLDRDGRPRGLRTLAFQPGSRVLIVGSEINFDSEVGQLEAWDLSTPERPARLGAFSRTHRRDVDALAFSPDGRLLVTGGNDGEILLWRLPDSMTSESLAGVTPTRLGFHSGSVTQIAFAQDGGRVATAGEDGTVMVWGRGNIADPLQLNVALRGHGTKVTAVAMSGNGNTVLSGGNDGRRLLWDINTVRRDSLTVKEGAFFIGEAADKSGTFSAMTTTIQQGKEAIFVLARNGPTEANTLFRWDTSKPDAPAITATMTISGVTAAALSPDGTRYVVGTAEGELSLWQLSADDPSSFEQVSAVTMHTDDVRTLAFSPDGTRIFSGGNDKRVITWEMSATGLISSTSQVSGTLMSEAVSLLEVSPDGNRLAIAHNSGLTLWDLGVGEPLCVIDQTDGTINVLALDATNTWIALANSDRTTISLWRQSTDGECQQGPLMIPQHNEPVSALAFSPDQTMLASGDGGGFLVLWNIARPEALVQPMRIFTSGVRKIIFNGDDELISAQQCCEIVRWKLDREALQERACRIVNRDLTPAERLLFLGADEPTKTRSCSRILGEE